MNETTQPAVAGPVEPTVRPVAEVRSARLRWHLPTPDADPVAKFLDNETHMLYDQAALDAAVAAERERWAATCERLADALEARLGTNAEEWADVRAARALLGRA